MSEIQLSIVVPLSSAQLGSMTAEDIVKAVEAGRIQKLLKSS